MNHLDLNYINNLKDKYKPGTKIKLINMYNEPYSVPSGMVGTVRLVDDMGQIHMKWDNGSTLAIIPNVDLYKVLN